MNLITRYEQWLISTLESQISTRKAVKTITHLNEPNQTQPKCPMWQHRHWTHRLRGHIQNEENWREENQMIIWHKWPVMLNIRYRWLNPRLYQFLQTRYKYLGVAQALKTDLALKKHTRVTKRDLKRPQTRAREWRRLVSLYLHTKINSKPQAAQITRSFFFLRKLVLKDFPK